MRCPISIRWFDYMSRTVEKMVPLQGSIRLSLKFSSLFIYPKLRTVQSLVKLNYPRCNPCRGAQH
jgi:hypothetical protein